MNNIVVDAIGNIDIGIIERYFKTKEKLIKNKNSIYNVMFFKKMVPIAACFALIISAAFAIIIPSLNQNSGDDPNTGDMTDSNLGNIIDSNNTSTERPSDNEIGNEYAVWNGLMVSLDLYNALIEAEDSQEFIILVDDSNIESFYDYVYEGKTYSEYEAERKELLHLAGKLSQLMKDGEWLKYGELAYTEGEYSKELYDKKIEFYGEDIINKFIVDGDFLRDDAQAYYSEIKQQAKNIYEKLDVIRNECDRSFAVEHFEVFKEAGYNVELKESCFWLLITKQEFSKLSVDKDRYSFTLVTPLDDYDSDKMVDC